MKAGKTKDGAGVVAEMLKHGGSLLREVILELFNEILIPDVVHPESWKSTRLVVEPRERGPRLTAKLPADRDTTHPL